MMKTAAWAIATAVIVYVSYSAGWQNGLQHAPEYAAAREAASKAYWESAEAAYTDEDRVCDLIFEEVGYLLSNEGMGDTGR